MEEHILVGLSSAPSNARIIRTAATMAAAFDCRLTALFVRTPSYEAMSEADRERLRANTALAEKLGAIVETVFGDDVSYQLAEYARLSKVTKIVVGRSAVTRKHRWSKPTLTEKLTAIAPDLDIHIIPDASVDAAYRPKQAKKKLNVKALIRDLGVALGILILTTFVCYSFSKHGFSEVNIITVYLLSVLLTAIVTSSVSSYVLSAVGSAVVFDYFFIAPYFSFDFYAQGFPVTVVIMLAASLIVGTLTDRMTRHTRQSTQAAYRTNLLLETNQLLQKAQTDDDILEVVKTQVSKLLDRETTVLSGVVASPGKDTLHYPVKVQDRVYGSVLVKGSAPLEAFENSVLLSILGECALALENSRNEREKEESKLQAENEKLRANLLRSISHDLRTPLTSISGNASILLSDSDVLDQETRQQIYTDIYDDSAWLYNLVENLLAITKIEEGRVKLQTQHQLVEEIVAEAMLHTNRKKAEHAITVSHQDDLLLAKCDARLIVQVVINLIDNAIKYTPEGSCISISTKAEDGMAVISVADNGEGIADTEKEKVFQMFYTGGSAVADSRRSLGLGLSLCKSIVEAHGGQISVLNNEPHGTVFRFTLPSREVELHE